jgi:HD-like signal output (HDOD) protein
LSKHLLLVDDEPMVLTGLQRSLRSMRDEWTMETALGGVAALEALARRACDVIVTDMRMPGMNGAELLNEVRRRSPQTVRVALSGQCDRETVMSGIGATHQYISKPCDAKTLKDTINHAIALRNQLQTASVTRVVSQMRTIPSLSTSFRSMMEELSAAEPRIDKLATLVAADMGMTAKCLQLVNSAFFGLRAPVSNVRLALNLLGLDMLKSLVLSTHIFAEFQNTLFDPKEISWLWEHSFAVSVCARAIGQIQDFAPIVIDDAGTGGLLHNTGKLVLASCLGKEYKMALDMTSQTGLSLVDAEYEVFGCNHAQVGAYLLGLWGLSDGIVESVAWHLNPAACPGTGEKKSNAPSSAFTAVGAVHAACAFHCAANPSRLSSGVKLDREYLRAIGLEGQIPLWNLRCTELLREGRLN